MPLEERYRLLKESLWLMEAFDDPEFSPHILADQRLRLIPQLQREIDAIEADQQWSASTDDASMSLNAKLPDGWTPKIGPPTDSLRYSAQSPTLSNGTRFIISAANPQQLLQSVNQSNSSLDGLVDR